MNVTKKFIARKISQNLSMSISVSEVFLDKFINTIKKSSLNKTVKIKNFGSFRTLKTAKRVGRNPKTKESYIIYPSLKVNFKTSKKVKEDLN